MARYAATVFSSRSAEDVFDYLANFSTVAEWDPGVASSQLTAGRLGEVGARFHVVEDTIGAHLGLDYEITEIERPRRVVLCGENATIATVDTIVVEARSGGGCEVNYQADVRLKSVLRLFDPALAYFLNRIAVRARKGLVAKLAD